MRCTVYANQFSQFLKMKFDLEQKSTCTTMDLDIIFRKLGLFNQSQSSFCIGPVNVMQCNGLKELISLVNNVLCGTYNVDCAGYLNICMYFIRYYATIQVRFLCNVVIHTALYQPCSMVMYIKQRGQLKSFGVSKQLFFQTQSKQID